MNVYILFDMVEEEIGEIYLDKEKALAEASKLNKYIHSFWAVLTKEVHE